MIRANGPSQSSAEWTIAAPPRSLYRNYVLMKEKMEKIIFRLSKFAIQYFIPPTPNNCLLPGTFPRHYTQVMW